MSLDILLNTTGRLASLVRGNATQQGAEVGKTGGEGQDDGEEILASFGALLEQKGVKTSVKNKDESAETDEPTRDERRAHTDEARDRSKDDTPENLVAGYALSQEIFSLAQAALGDGETRIEEPATIRTAPSLDEVADESVLPDGDGMGIDVSAEMTSPAAATGKSEGKRTASSMLAANSKADTVGQGKAESVISLDGKVDTPNSQGQPAESAQEAPDLDRQISAILPDDHADGQSQQMQRPLVMAEVRSSAPPVQNMPRIADVQVLSERSNGAVKTLQIRLDPAELGAVTARIRVVQDGVEVHLVAEKTHAAEVLANDRSMIEKTLKAAGIADDGKISVTVADRSDNATAVHAAPTAQGAGHQNSGAPHQSFSMGAGSENRENAQAQMQFAGGEGRSQGRADHDGRGETSGRISGEAGDYEGGIDAGRRGGGLIV